MYKGVTISLVNLCRSASDVAIICAMQKVTLISQWLRYCVTIVAFYNLAIILCLFSNSYGNRR
jgi:hypothetical protein